MQRKTSLNMAQETLGSDKGSNSFQSMEQRRALACSESVRWYSQDLVRRGGGRTVNRISGKGEKKEEEYYRKECQC